MMKISPIPYCFVFMAFLGINLNAQPLEVGAEAPRISAVDETGSPLDLGKLYDGGTVLVYFYPKADTPGCTAQSCSLRDGIEDLAAVGVTVVGVSRDTPGAQKSFKEKHQLPFALIADTDGKVIEAFGVPTVVMGIPKRQSFLVKDGKVVWRSLSAQTKSHADEVTEALAGL